MRWFWVDQFVEFVSGQHAVAIKAVSRGEEQLDGYLPADREPPTEVGIAGLEAFPRRYFAQWVSPWRWDRIRAESGTRPTS